MKLKAEFISLLFHLKKPKTMSQKKQDKGKLFHKLHQLQKRMTRMEENSGHSSEKMKIRQSRINNLLEAVKGRGKQLA